MLQNTKRQVELFEMHCFTMFITAIHRHSSTRRRKAQGAGLMKTLELLFNWY